MGMTTYRRMDLESIEDMYIGEDDSQRLNSAVVNDHKVQAGALAHIMGVAPGTIHRYRREGIPYWSADRIAIHLGTHPTMIWPDFNEGPVLCT